MTEEVGMSATNMCNRFVDHMETAWKKWKPRKRFTLYQA